jgi:hypothetical protein
MERIRGIEKSLANVFKDAPALPKSTKQTIADFWPWVALVLGVLQLAAAWSLWRLYDRVQPLVDLANTYASYFTGTSVGYSTFDKIVIFAAIATLVVEGLIMLMAFSPLQKKLKRGWDLLFLAALVNVVYSVVTIFIDGRGVGTFIMSLIGTAIGFYFLFQIRDLYGSKATPASTPKVTA